MISRLLIALGLSALATGCAEHDAGRCETTADCTDDTICVDRRCAPPLRCADDGECPDDTICLAGACTAQSCRDAGDCPGARVCRDGWCAPRGDGCDGGPGGPGGTGGADGCVIAVSDAAPAPCRADRDCGPDARCERGACLAGCRVDPPSCEPGRVCERAGGRCVVAGCRADPDCPAGAFCDDATRSCAPGCRVAPDDCARGRCDASTRRCQCALDDDCPAEEFCADDGACRRGCRLGGTGCGEAACDPVTRGCAPRPCGRDADCPLDAACGPGDERDGALRCVPVAGSGRAEAPCAGDAMCASGVCIAADGVCFAACLADEDCPSELCAAVELLPGLVRLSCRPG